jgi:hypothetical protein
VSDKSLTSEDARLKAIADAIKQRQTAIAAGKQQ